MKISIRKSLKSLRWKLVVIYRDLNRTSLMSRMIFMVFRSARYTILAVVSLTWRILRNTSDTFVRIVGIALAIWLVGQFINVPAEGVAQRYFGDAWTSQESLFPGDIVEISPTDLRKVCEIEHTPGNFVTDRRNLREYSILAQDGSPVRPLLDVAKRVLGTDFVTDRSYLMEARMLKDNRPILPETCGPQITSLVSKGACLVIVRKTFVTRGLGSDTATYAIPPQRSCIYFSNSKPPRPPNRPISFTQAAHFLSLIKFAETDLD